MSGGVKDNNGVAKRLSKVLMASPGIRSVVILTVTNEGKTALDMAADYTDQIALSSWFKRYMETVMDSGFEPEEEEEDS
jgi:hypothetical protein